jgi:arylsulfatase A-like enzyme/Flp pilus assembly protein TadD
MRKAAAAPCLLLAALLLGSALPALPAVAAEQPPNVLLVTLDTVRADRLGCYGYQKIRTPHIDRLASEGVLFEKAFTPVPITLPAHAVLFTGTYPMMTGMHDFSGNSLNPKQATMASLLRDQGYTTAGFVGSAVLDSRFGLGQGFDVYHADFDFSRLHETNLDAMEMRGDLVVDQALAWLEQNQRRPFFLWVHLYDPHHPYQPPPPYDSEYKARPYDGEIAFADAQAGRLLEHLRAKELYDQTLIVLASDHGEGLGEHNEKTHGFFIYTTTLQIPLIFKLPAPKSVPRAQVAVPVTLVDVLPTVLQLVGLPVSGQIQGRSLLPLMLGREEESAEGMYAESFLPRLHFNWSELRSLRRGPYHFIDAPRPELYDLSTDPRELRNLYEQRGEKAEEMRRQLDGFIAKHSRASGQETAETTPLDPALAERLKSLGYVAVSGGTNPSGADATLPDPKDRIEMYELVSEAIADSQSRRYAASVSKLQAALKIEEESLAVHYLLALNYYRLQDFPQAIRQFQRVIRLQPDYSLAVYYLGLAYGKRGDWDRAIAALKRALELDATNFSAAFNLGAAYLREKKVPEALAAFQQSVSIYPDYGAGHRAVGEVLLYQGRVDEAIGALRKAVSLEPNDRQGHLALAKALQKKGLHQEAREELRKAQPLTPPQ